MNVPSLERIIFAVSAATQVEDPEIRRLHIATARMLLGPLQERVAQVAADVERLEKDLVRRTAQPSLPGVKP